MKRSDIEKICESGLITEEQRDAIIARFVPKSCTSGRWLIVSLSLMALVFLASGIILMANLYWGDMPSWARVAPGVGLMLSVWVAGFLLSERMPWVSEILGLVGASLWLWNLYEFNAVYSPGLSFVEYVCIYFAGLALIPLVLRQRLVFGVVAASSLLLFFLLGDAAMSIGLVVLGFPGSVQLQGVAFCVLALFWWLLAEKSRDSRYLYRGYSWLGIPMFLIFMVTVYVVYMFIIPGEDGETESSWLGCSILSAVALALFLLLKSRSVRWGYWLLLALCTCGLIPLALCFRYFPAYKEALGAGVCLLYAILLMYGGVCCARKAWINYGVLMALLVFAELIGKYMENEKLSALVLIISGSVALVFLFLLESQRRYMLRKIRDKHSLSDNQS